MNNLICNKQQQGFTLIEVLVTLLILSIGMLGVAGMQVQGMRSGSLATQRLAVVMKAQEIAERIRINSGAVNSYEVGAGGIGVDHGCFNGKECSSAQLAEYDVYLWKQDLFNVLPSDASATITVVNPNPANAVATVDIAFNWTGAAGAQNYITTLQVDSTNTVQD